MPPGICLAPLPIAPLLPLSSSHTPFSSPLRGGEREECFYISSSPSICLLPLPSSVMTTSFPRANQYLNVSSLFIYLVILFNPMVPTFICQIINHPCVKKLKTNCIYRYTIIYYHISIYILYIYIYIYNIYIIYDNK